MTDPNLLGKNAASEDGTFDDTFKQASTEYLNVSSQAESLDQNSKDPYLELEDFLRKVQVSYYLS